jgi:diacylglycerol kinase
LINMDTDRRRTRTWWQKFGDAFRGLKRGVRGQSSFFVHFFAAAAVIGAGVSLGVSQAQWCLLILSIALVLAVEMLNTALETLAKVVSDREHHLLRDALDMGSAAVLLSAAGAVAVGIVVFGHRLAVMLGWLP